MNVLVIGGGGREHALVKALSRSEHTEQIHAVPGNSSMEKYAAVHSDINDSDIERIVALAIKENITWTVIGPEAPLTAGLADALEAADIKVFGPRKLEAQLESSKAFAKNIMIKYGIPTAEYQAFTNLIDATEYIKQQGAPIVIKKDGLAAGKGVAVAMTETEALDALKEMFVEGENKPVVIEEFLEGEEFSLMVLVNGDYILPFDIVAQDHKRAYDSDTGPNTGGMGAYAPVRHIGEDVIDEAINNIVKPTAEAMVKEGLDYFGVMYLGAIITKEGVKTIEFNARFGDPEAQILLELLESDFIDVLEAVKNQEPYELKFSRDSMLGVILASQGYPKTYEKGASVIIPERLEDEIFNSGLKHIEDERYETTGGRVMLVTGRGSTLEEAKKTAYKNTEQIKFNNEALFYRNDIGERGV
ncbi:phosphoribosylamine--glycine ligase [Jeotgalicoccus coquinae]|uniref:Phosphoribosylamine--glycine ligase n=1 Tax=Jeotgalicoccus coquinae TaxID=709509 RepID=A0A6V7RSQ7_9STAP|nr:phosphoribosylamine--glycine ligase [Jeotgalicoccus coquinae]MBB6424189.1 phosphoribosylamine--glycine ligase [Jeotgalicoccus coquinae]GGE25775.1 phosphoribosylamine--glycine ligase [Jeotgalicoccus coquinae]CAD2081495.1 Phosphoribosylamine--glycine ligase [Jeotgalicoccus coquinae]